MKNQGRAGAPLRFFRQVIVVDLSLAAIVWLTGYVFDWRTPEEYGTTLVSAGIALILFACLTEIGGLSSRAEDAEAFSLSGGGNMSENLRRISERFGVTLPPFAGLSDPSAPAELAREAEAASWSWEIPCAI